MALKIETTALAVINWIQQDKDEFSENIESGMQFIIASYSRDGHFSSTQSTILSLKALNEYLKEYLGNANTIHGRGNLELRVDNSLVSTLKYNSKDSKQVYD